MSDSFFYALDIGHCRGRFALLIKSHTLRHTHTTTFFAVSEPDNHNRKKIFQKSVHSLGNYSYICLVNSVIVRKPNF